MSEPKHIWDKRESETSKAFHAFVMYLELGANRSCAIVAKTLGFKNPKGVEEWCTKNEWVRRAGEYDAYCLSESLIKHRLRREKVLDYVLLTFEMRTRALAKRLAANPKYLDEDISIEDLTKNVFEIVKLMPTLATTQDMNITQFIDDATADMPDDEIAKMLDNSDIKESLDGLLNSFQTTS